MKVHQIMTAHARCVSPDNTLVEAAGLMRELDVGALPVCEDDRLVGMITDRDMTIRATALGRDPNGTSVSEIMSPGVVTVFADDEVEQAARLMEEREIRRLAVLNRAKRLVGVLSLGDMATSSHPAFAGLTLREISQPINPNSRDRKRESMGRMAGGARMPRVPGETAAAPSTRESTRAGGRERRSGARKSSRTRTSRTGKRSTTSSRKTRSGGSRSRKSTRRTAA